MFVDYRIIKRPIPNGTNGDSKYYALVKRNKEVSLRDLIEKLEIKTALTTSDIVAVLEALFKEIPQHLFEGRTVRLGDLGSFYLNLHSEGTDTEEEFTIHKIKGNSIRYRPGQGLRDKMLVVKYKKYENGEQH